MPNRIIKESICTSRKINELSADEEVFYYRLLVNCDDYGCFFGDPDILAARLFPRKRIAAEKAEKWRDKICRVGLARLYADNDETYIEVLKWSDNQQIRNRRRKFPVPTELISIDINCNQVISNASLIQSNPIQSESNTNPNTKPKPNTPAIPPDVSQSLRESILEFISHRKAIKKPMTDLAVRKLVDELNKLADSDDIRVAIINRSISNGWLGVFPLERTQNNRPPRSGRKTNEGNFTSRQYTEDEWAAMYTEPPEVSE